MYVIGQSSFNLVNVVAWFLARTYITRWKCGFLNSIFRTSSRHIANPKLGSEQSNMSKESKNESKKSVIFSVLKEFAESTSMDGLRFIANEKASFGER